MSATPPLDYAELYRVLAESAPDAIITIDEASTVLSANPAAERMFGYSAAELIGGPLDRLMPERMRARHANGMTRYRATGVRNIPWSGFRLPVLTKDGRERTVEISFGEFVADGRRVFSGILRDVSEQLRALDALREGEARARRLLALASGLSEAATPEAVADAIFLEGLAVLGGDAGSLAIVHEVDGQPTGFELVRSAGYDERVVRHYQRSPLRPGRPLTHAIVTRRPVLVDSAAALTERFPDAAPEMIAMGYPVFAVIPVVHGEHVLAALNFSFRNTQAFDDGVLTFLETVGQLCAQALVRARLFESEQTAHARAVRANQAKTDLLAKVSHETRQPVHATIGWSDTLALGIFGNLTVEQMDALHRIKQNQERLLSVLNDLLDISRIEAGKLELRPVVTPLAELLEAVEAAILPQMRAKAIKYTSSTGESGLAVHADRDQVTGILTNLISNAVKFTAEGGRIAVTCSADGGRVRVRVEDDGVGVPSDALERIFEPFFQVDSGLTRTTMGTGLGLSISRESARAMGGDISVESREGAGSIFTLTLPAG